MRSRSRTIPALESLERRCLLTPVIALNFDGHTEAGQWASTYNNGKPFTVAGVGYDAATRERIRLEVAEDFAPFQVDVVLGQLAGRQGVEVVFTADQSWLTDNVGYAVGGVAFTGTWNQGIVCWAFNGGAAAAATASHEAGHTLGLSHAGTGVLNVNYQAYYYGHGDGPTGWAPLMGAGFAKPLSQWSKGEYPNAYNTQDQVAIIASRLGVKPDPPDMKELLGSATGIIETRTDVDGWYFTITTQSDVTIAADPAAVGPNLDILLKLQRDGGELIAQDNPTGRLDASITVTLQPGTYIVTIDGVGKAATASDPGYSDYGSLGQYTVTLSQTPTVAPAPEYLVGSKWTSNPGRIAPWQITAVRLAGAWSADALVITGRTGAIATACTQQDGFTVWTIAPVTADRLSLSGVVADRLDVLFGDVNGDGVVTIVDALLQRGYNGSADRWADIDGDGLVTMTDAMMLRGMNGQRIPS